MDNAQAADRLQDLYLTGVRRNGNDIGVGAYGKVFEVECFGTVYAAKEIHSILVQGVRREEFEATKKTFLTECIRSGSLSHPNVVHFLGVYNPGDRSLITSSGDGADAGEPYVSGGKVPKYSDVREFVYVIGCVSRIVVSPWSSSSYRSQRPFTK